MRVATCPEHPGIITEHKACYRCHEEAPVEETTITLKAAGRAVTMTEEQFLGAVNGGADAIDMETGELLHYQPTLDDKVFADYTPEHQVGVKLTKGSSKWSLGTFGKLLSGEKLERGREVIVTARYFAKSVHVPATSDEGLVYEGEGTVELELLGIRTLEVGRQLLRQASPWKPCTCLEPYDQEEDGDYPGGRNVLAHPLDGWSAQQGCTVCAGVGYTRPGIKPDDVNPEDEGHVSE